MWVHYDFGYDSHDVSFQVIDGFYLVTFICMWMNKILLQQNSLQSLPFQCWLSVVNLFCRLLIMSAIAMAFNHGLAHPQISKASERCMGSSCGQLMIFASSRYDGVLFITVIKLLKLGCSFIFAPSSLGSEPYLYVLYILIILV